MSTGLRKDIKEAFEHVKDNDNFDSYRITARQIKDSGKFYSFIYDYVKKNIDEGQLSPEMAYALLIGEVRDTLTSLKRIENLIASKVER